MTYSLVARDPETGELGVAVQSRAFNTAAAVCWARPGVGAIATQSFSDRRYGWRGLELLGDGVTPVEVLARLRSEDELPGFRQVGLLDATGVSAQHTGADCIPAAGHASGVGWAAQANLVESPSVWESMGEAFETTHGTLAQRLLAALDAAEAAGGDWRGRQAGGILVVPAEGEPWERVIDLRVEDSKEPLVELRRLLFRAEGYRASNRAEHDRAAIARAAGLPELDVVWAAIVDAAQAGEHARAQELLAPLLAQEPRWALYAQALGKRGLLASVDELLAE